MHTYIHVGLCIFPYINTHKHIHTYTYIHIYRQYIYIQKYTHKYIEYIYTNTNTNIHKHTNTYIHRIHTIHICGPSSSVGIATDYGLDGPGIESRWGRDFPPVQTKPGAHPASCTMVTGSFSGVKCGRGVLLNSHLLLAPWSWKSRTMPLSPSDPQPGL
jgi:hypothetical protein